MSKRVRFDDSSIAPSSSKIRKQETPSTSKDVDFNHETSAPGSRFKEDHSLDSDDEDEVKNDYEKLTEEDIEGAEDDVEEEEDEDDGMRITPFNLKEEMEEGDFDTQGHYHFKKEREIRDNWLDNIDWVKVKKKPTASATDNNSDDEPPQFNEIKMIEGILALLGTGETVSKGLRRLGSDKSTKTNKSRNWKREKLYDMEVQEQDETDDTSTDAQEATRKKNFLELTELVDQMAGSGHYDIYSDTFEKLQYKLNSLRVSEKASKGISQILENTSAEDALDIFADDIDDAGEKKKQNGDSNGADSSKDMTTDDNSVKWEYKWTESTTELFGPFSSSNMEEWKSQGFFNDDVRVRRADKPDAPFYPAKRIEFDLYD
uniref:GYF domain-containing protein n=1 Tax=Ciona savignyi TaxID=51511 RepID=H2Z487_CIOSA